MRKYGKYILLTVCLPAIMLQAGAQRVWPSRVPEPVQESFYLAHPSVTFFQKLFMRWDQTRVGYCARYNFPYNEVTSLFQSNGEWISTRYVIPESNLPLRAHDFISDKYAFYKLRSCTFEEDRWQGRHYYALFSIKGIEGYLTEVCFDLQGNVVSIDGNDNEDWDEFEPLNEEEVLQLQTEQVLAESTSPDTVQTVSNADTVMLSIGFFAWKEEYVAQAAQSDKNSLKISSAFDKEKSKQTRHIYQKQSRRDFAYAKAVAQSKSAEQKQKELEEESKETVKQPVVAEVFAEPEQVAAQEPEQPAAAEQPAAEETQEPVSQPRLRIEGIQAAISTPAAPAAVLSVKTVFPESIQQAFNKRFPKAEGAKYYRDTTGDYRAVFTNFGQKAEAVFLHDGTHTTTALFFGKKEISYPIAQYIAAQPQKLTFVTGKRIVYESRYRSRFSAENKPQNYYEVVVFEKNKEDKSRIYHMLTFDHKGHFVSSVLYDYVGSK